MNNIKTSFSIKDLENLSGIKAHTIRIWEKRYELFEPSRTETNIRYYSLKSLQKLLNVSFLNKNGLKVSKIASLDDNDIPILVNSIAKKENSSDSYTNIMKVAMLNFDQKLFDKAFLELSNQYRLDEIFNTVFIPLLDTIGLLWQTNTITPAHEHFIVELIKQKLIIATNENDKNSLPTKTEKVYALFLPENEMHELGLLYINYILSLKNYHKIYLGQSVPSTSLKHLCETYENITFISVFTIKIDENILKNHISTFSEELFDNNKNKLLISSRFSDVIQNNTNHPRIQIYKNTKELVENNFNLETT